MAARRTDPVLPQNLDLSEEGDGLDRLMDTAAALSKKPVGMPKLFRIVVEENDAIPPTGLMLGLNGKAFLIRPGEEVRVPEGIIEILDHARMDVPKIDSATRRISGWSQRPRFPYRHLGVAA